MISSYFFLALYTIYPVAIFFVLKRQRQKGGDMQKDESYMNTYGALTEGMKTKFKSDLAQPILAWLMRAVLVLLLVSNDTHYQLYFYQLNIFFYTAYIG